jgi:L-amino acid N-acyltransferase YncA
VPTVRDATPDDAAACAAVYAPYVTGTAVTFELEPPDAGEMARRIAAAQAAHAWLVLVADGRVAGYAYGGPFKDRPAYRFACEVSVYLRTGLRRTGAGRQLYAALLPQLGGMGYRTAVAGMTLPNPASEGLHRACGFEHAGTFRRVGWKLGAWHDVAWMQRTLGDGRDPDRPPGE